MSRYGIAARTLLHRCLAVLPAVVLVVGSARSSKADDPSRPPILSAREDTPPQQGIRKVLGFPPVTLEFVQTPLSDVVDFLRDYTKVNIVLDRRSLEKEGITGDSPVTIHVEQIRLMSALNLLLGSLNLTWIVKDDVLLFTSIDGAAQHIVARTYPVGDLAATEEEVAHLLALTQWVANPDRATIGVAGGGFGGMGGGRAAGGSAAPQPEPASPIHYLASLKAIVVIDNEAIHSRIARLLDRLRAGPDPEDLETVRQIQAKLKNPPVTLEFVETPLSDVIDFLRDYTKVNIVLDRAQLEQEGVTPDAPVTIHVEQIALRSALTLLLGQLNLSYHIHNECIVVTSAPDVKTRRVLRVYPVGKMLGENAGISPYDWVVMVSGLAARTPSGPSASGTGKNTPQGVPGAPQDLVPVRGRGQASGGTGAATSAKPPVIDYYGPTGSLVVFAPEPLQAEVENLIGLLVRTAGTVPK